MFRRLSPTFAAALLAAGAPAQSTVPATPRAPWIEEPVESTDRPCTIEALEIAARVDGLHARVSTTIAIRNPNPRPLSAPLAFPLPDDAAVCGYALEIDGAMVDGVVVPKEKARVAFETEQRRGVDPGLVEAVRGNVYRTRVYPVPAQGTRRVRIDWTAPLVLGPDGSSAALALPMPDVPLSRRTVTVEVADTSAPEPPTLGGFGAPRDDLLIGLPVLPDALLSLERTPDGDVWFCASVKPSAPMPAAAPVAPAEAFTVLWDASGSRAGDHSREFAFLRALRAAPAGAFRLVVFRNVPEPARDFDSVETLVAALADVAYDGGTDLAALAPVVASAQGPVYLFTDGMDTLSGKPLEFASGANISALLSGAERDAEALRQACGGRVFDPALSPDDTVHALARRVRSLEGAGFADVQGIGSDASRRATVLGRLTTDAKATLRYDHDGGGASLELSARDARPGTTLATAWAAARVRQLAPRADDHADELLALGRRFGLASPVTSLLVLESLDQWLRHDIVPPDSLPQLQAQWYEAKKRRPGPTPEEKKTLHLARVRQRWEERLRWWNTDWSAQPKKKPAAPVAPATSANGAPAPTRSGGILGRMVQAVAGAASPRRSVASDMAYDDAEEGISYGVAAAPAAAAPAAPSSRGPVPAGSIAIKAWAPDTPYLKALDAAFADVSAPAGDSTPDRFHARDAYLAQRAEWARSPAFYLDCAGWFFAKGDTAFAVRVLSNLAELGIDDAALLRVMAWRLVEARAYDPAIAALRRVCKLRPEDGQSWRDLALALDAAGRAESDKDRAAALVAEALSLYRKVVLTPWDRHPTTLSVFAAEEHNALLDWCQAHRAIAADGDAPGPLPDGLQGTPDCDLRVVLAWDADETDVDLHVTEPSGEEAYYGHRRTASGGDVSEDITDGYGPEEYLLRKAPRGAYRIRAHYFASHRQEVFGPATATATIFTDWGRPNQRFQTLSIRLDQARQMIQLGTVTVPEAAPEAAP